MGQRSYDALLIRQDRTLSDASSIGLVLDVLGPQNMYWAQVQRHVVECNKILAVEDAVRLISYRSATVSSCCRSMDGDQHHEREYSGPPWNIVSRWDLI